MPQVQVYFLDYFFFFLMGLLIYNVCQHWSDYASCKHPLNVWLIVDAGTFILIRIIAFIFQCFSISPRHELNTYGTHAIMMLNIFIIYPFMWIWIFLGCSWYFQSGYCLPRPLAQWGFMFWLSWNFMYVASIGALILAACRSRHHEPNNENCFQFLIAIVYGAHQLALVDQHEGLTEQEIQELPRRPMKYEFSVLMKFQLIYKKNVKNTNIDPDQEILCLVAEEYDVQQDQIWVKKENMITPLKNDSNDKEVNDTKEKHTRGDIQYHVLIKCQNLTYDMADKIIAKGTSTLRSKILSFLRHSTYSNTSVITILDPMKEHNEVFCSICRCELEEGEDTRVLPCDHYFHVPCIDEWLLRKNTCPNCRITIPGASTPLLSIP